MAHRRPGLVRLIAAAAAMTVTMSLAAAPKAAADVESPYWVTGGNAPWGTQTSVTHDGVRAAQSGAVRDSQRSWLETTVVGPGKVSFWWGVSSEVNTITPGGSDDNLRFYIGGVEQAPVAGSQTPASWH